jgi:hypothetical protein
MQCHVIVFILCAFPLYFEYPATRSSFTEIHLEVLGLNE